MHITLWMRYSTYILIYFISIKYLFMQLVDVSAKIKMPVKIHLNEYIILNVWSKCLVTLIKLNFILFFFYNCLKMLSHTEKNPSNQMNPY